MSARDVPNETRANLQLFLANVEPEQLQIKMYSKLWLFIYSVEAATGET